MSARAKTILAWAIIAAVLGLAIVCGQPAPTPQPAVSDEEIQGMSWDAMIATVKGLRDKAAAAIEQAAKQKDEIARSAALVADVLEAARRAIIRLDEHDQQVVMLAAENQKNKEDSLRKDTIIAKKDAAIFRLTAFLVGLVFLIVAYVGLKLFTRLPIP